MSSVWPTVGHMVWQPPWIFVPPWAHFIVGIDHFPLYCRVPKAFKLCGGVGHMTSFTYLSWLQNKLSYKSVRNAASTRCDKLWKFVKILIWWSFPLLPPTTPMRGKFDERPRSDQILNFFTSGVKKSLAFRGPIPLQQKCMLPQNVHHLRWLLCWQNCLK